MTTVNNSLSWIVGLVVVIAALAIAFGFTLSRTDLANFNTSAADMRAKDQVTTAKAQQAAAEQRLYQAQKEAEIAAQQQASAFHAVKSSIDQQVYRIQQTAQAMKQVADAKQYEALLLVQAETNRQRQLAQIEVQRTQQLAQIRATEQSQAQQRTEQAAHVAEEIKWSNLFNTLLACVLILLPLAVAVSIVLGTMILAWARLQRARLELTSAKAVTQSQVMRTVTSDSERAISESAISQCSDREYWKERRIQARAIETAWRTMQIRPDLAQGMPAAKYKDLPLAVVKGD